jgi:hypothetical protein
MNVFRSKALSATPVPVVSTDAAFQAAPEAPSAPFRMLLISFLAAAIGLVAGVVAFALYKLIGLFTNLFFPIAGPPIFPAHNITTSDRW